MSMQNGAGGSGSGGLAYTGAGIVIGGTTLGLYTQLSVAAIAIVVGIALAILFRRTRRSR